ncbi:hypothetical protein AAF712_011143 [Marasmius tenuissimus]|uniref:Uncharacterized protein n=1 Tax=Marasmius tenuissimus TaxID=585030 RepID=A0ABR2ZKT4_9AGAR
MFASTTKAFAVVAAFLAVSGQVGVGATPAGVNDVEARASYYTGDGIGACGKQSSASQLVAAVAAPVFDNYPGAPPNPNKYVSTLPSLKPSSPFINYLLPI